VRQDNSAPSDGAGEDVMTMDRGVDGGVERARSPLDRGRFLRGVGGLAAVGLAGTAPLTAFARGVEGSGSSGGQLIERLDRPLDLETPVRYFTTYLTPTDAFFVRSHFGAPDTIDARTWRMRVYGEVKSALTVGLTDLRRFEEVSLVSTIQCSGNGRAYYTPHPSGVQWQRGAVSTAKWTGVRLADVLRHAGIQAGAHYVWLRGRDSDPLKTPRFLRSIPLSVALEPTTILAYKMNDEPLPILHGQPLRLIVPGWVADDQVKWLSEIQVRSTEAPGYFYQAAYRYPNHLGKPGVAVPPTREHPLTLMNVKSLIAYPDDGRTLTRGLAAIQGVAWSGRARIVRVDVSVDGGRTYRAARLGREDTPYAWRLWSLPYRFDHAGAYTIMARATDSAGATQPVTSPWNPSGYLWNGIDSVRVTVR